MVALVSGSGLGLFNTSNNTLNSPEQGRLGQASEKSYVNVANGNLVLRFEDEQLSGAGLDMSALRTYNSLGQASDGDGDNWQWEGERRLSLNGTVNTPGSTLSRTTGDGHTATYIWSSLTSRYESHEGAGATDFILWNSSASAWTWIDGSALVSDTYNLAGRLTTQTDKHGNTLSFSYDFDGHLTSIEDTGNKQKILFTYLAIPNNPSLVRLQRMDTYSLLADPNGLPTSTLGNMVTQVGYEHDSLGRLIKVSTDLTPGTDNSITDNQIYITQYAYDGNSLRITNVSQSDGSAANFTYDTNGKIETVTDSQGTQTFVYTQNSTSISNNLGQVWLYEYDNNGQLTLVQSPANNGQIVIARYQYDGNGNLVQMTDGRSNIVSYEYDAADNLLLERDALGNTITRTYNTNNQVLTETRYLTPDPDGAGSLQASDTLTTRFVYDSQNRLRFTISAQGRVSEHQYTNINASGISINGVVARIIRYSEGLYSVSGLPTTTSLSETQLMNWANGQQRQFTEVTENQYDWRGNLKQITGYAAVNINGTGILDSSAVVTQYIYNEHGQLLNTIALRGNTRTTPDTLRSVIYDGMGRQLSVTSGTTNQTYIYDGANKKISIINSAGMTSTTAYDNTGRVINVVQSATNEQDRQTRFFYDQAGNLVMKEDAAGNREYKFYDALGRLQYSVDAIGAITENQYNENNQLTKQLHFNTLANTTLWFSNSLVTKSTLTKGTIGTDIIVDTANDRSTQYQYDNAGRLSAQIDAAGTASYIYYDGTSAVTKHQTGDRISRYFYDSDGKQIGVLDASGYLSENTYDAAGRLTKTVRYSSITRAMYRASGTFAELKTGMSASGDLKNYFYYDARDRLIGSVNEKGALTETIYDDANLIQTVKTYQTPVVVGSSDTLTQLTSRAGVALAEITRFDKNNRILTQTAVDGTTTDYEYDTSGRLTRTVIGKNQFEADMITDSQRATRYQYNAFGDVTGVVRGKGEATLSVNPLAADIKAVIESYGVQKLYDGLGRLTQTIDANGNKIFFYYDNNSRLRFSVNALGEIKENQYNAFGQVASTTTYAARLPTINGLTGGIVTDNIATQFTSLANITLDRKELFTYDSRGLVMNKTDAEGYSSNFTYNQHGNLQTETRTFQTGNTVSNQYSWSNRGELTQTINDVGGLNQKTNATYDAFGRIRTTTSANGKVTTYTYENGGRVVNLIDPLNRKQRTEYDVFGRTLQTTDAAGNATVYSYDNINRTIAITTPEGTRVTTVKNRHGETVSVVDGRGGVRSYTYDKNGQLTNITDALNRVIATNSYDNSHRLIDSTDANGVITHLTYDAVNCVAARSVDPAGLNLQTQYVFNSFGEAISVVEGAGTPSQQTTQYTYNRKGQLQTIITDPNGLALQTSFTYDGMGDTLTVSKGTAIDPNQFVTQYTYDKLGRRISEIDAAGSLNLTTLYKYDANSNVTRKIDAKGNSTWYVYDANNRQTFSVNALGEVNETQYNNAGQVSKTVQYNTRLDATTLNALGDVVTTLAPVVNNATDSVKTFFYDKDGRLTQTILDPLGLALTTQYRYDTNNNLTQKIDANGNSTWYVYDKTNRQTFSVNALGEISETQYDAAGHATKTIAYATKLKQQVFLNWGSVASAFTPVIDNTADAITVNEYDHNGRLSKTIVDPNGLALTTEYRYDANNHLTRTINANGNSTWYLYDKAGRHTHTINALGEVSETRFDAIGESIQHTQYATRLSASTLSSLGDSIASLPSITLSTNDKKKQNEYDKQGRLTRAIVDPGGLSITTQYRYDSNGNLTRTIDANGNSSWQIYDAANRKIQTINATGVVTDLQYDGEGQLVKTTRYANALGDTTLSGLGDVPARITATADGARDEIEYYVYDAAGRLRFSVDAMLIVTETISDALGKTINTKVHDAPLTATQRDALQTAITNQSNTETLLASWYVRVGDSTHSGLRAFKNGAIILPLGDDFVFGQNNVKAGDTVTATVWFKADAGTNVSASFVDVGNNAVNHAATVNAVGNGDWQQVTLSITLTTDDSLLLSLNGDAGKNFVFDDVVISSAQLGTSIKVDFESIPIMPVSPTGGSIAFKYTDGTSYQYDKAGRLIQKVVDAGGLRIATQYAYDAKGNLACKTDPNGNNTWFVYDKSNRQIYTIDPLGAVTETQYNAENQVSKQIRYATYQSSVLANLRVVNTTLQSIITSSEDRVTTYQYDAAGRMTQSTVDPSGLAITTFFKYDADGQLTRKIDANGNSTWYVYNNAGQVTYTINALGQVMQNVYSNGLLSYTRQYYQALLSVASLGDVVTSVALTTHIADAFTYYTYDAANRVRFVSKNSDKNNYLVTENCFDAFGNITTTIGYDKYLSATALQTSLADGKLSPAELQTQINLLGYSSGNYGNARVTRYAYDANNRLRFTINVQGYVSENIYDKAGRIIQQTEFSSAPTLANYTTATINTALDRAATTNHTSRFVYDANGRLIQSTDALNNSEYTQYDAVGNKILFTNKRGFVWSYQYDKAGRLTEEVSPAVDVATITTGNVVTATSRKLVTSISYDPLGNVKTRTEGILRNGSVNDASQARTTSYDYDKANRQIKTTLPGWYDPTTGSVEATAATGRFQRTAEVTYDAMGNAVVNKIRTSATDFMYQTKAYDSLGRVIYDIDALNQVTQLSYDTFGNQQQVISFDSHIGGLKNTGDILTIISIRNSVATFSYRYLINFYDSIGRKIEVRYPASTANFYSSTAAVTNSQANATGVSDAPQTIYSYDAFGNVTQTRTKIGGTEWAYQWSFYNSLNQKVSDVQEAIAGQAYVTNYQYDAFGNTTQVSEFANAVSIPLTGVTAVPTTTISTNDRVTKVSYDALNRKTDIKTDITFYAQAHADLFVQVTLTDRTQQQTVYDALGNVVNQIDTLGNQTQTTYDAIGRATQIKMPTRSTANADKTGASLDPFLNQVNATPTISFQYNAFGQTIQETRGAGGGRGLASGDIVLTHRYDLAGNRVVSKNISGNFTARTYNALSQVTSEKQTVSAAFSDWTAGNYTVDSERRYEYDLLGHQTATYDIYTVAGVKQRSGKQNVYNRFGEVVADNSVYGAADGSMALTVNTLATNTYDAAGRLVTKAAVDGTTKYFYNLLGKVTRVEQQGNNSAADGTVSRVTEYGYDKMGHVLIQRAPQFEVVTQELGTTTAVVTPLTRQNYDRWGNVVNRTDSNGNVTTYTYDRNNMITSETLPTTTILKSDGTTWTPTRTHEIHYDLAGRAVEDVQLTNGIAARKRYSEYNQVGQLKTYVDATGVRTEYAYDAFGNQIGTRNGVGTVTLDSFDASGNQLTHSVLRRSATSGVNNSYDYYYSPIAGVTASSFTPQEVVLQQYSYDQANHRTVVRDAAGYAQYNQFDERGNITRTRNQLGIVTKIYEYNEQNKKSKETDALGNILEWTYNNLGQLTSTRDLSSNFISYTYNDFGQLSTQTYANDSNLTTYYSYYDNGLTKAEEDRRQTFWLNETTLASVAGTSSIQTIYSYDVDGHRVRELRRETRSSLDGTSFPLETYEQETRSAFDKAGQLLKVRSPSGTLVYYPSAKNDPRVRLGTWDSRGTVYSTTAMPDVDYSYDEFGNKIATSASSATYRQYDKEGRVVGEQAGTPPKIFSYDKAGRLQYVETNGGVIWAGAPGSSAITGFATILDKYRYTDTDQIQTIASARLTHSTSYAFNAITAGQDGALSVTDSRLYNARGSVTKVVKNGSAVTDYTYRADGSLATQRSEPAYVSGATIQTTTFDNYDAAGNLKHYKTDVYNFSGQYLYKVEHQNTFSNSASGYRQLTETVTSTQANSVKGTTNYYYNRQGELSKVEVTEGGKLSTRKFVNDNGNHIIFKVEDPSGTAAWSQRNVFVDETQIASLSSKGNKFDYGITGTTNEVDQTSDQYWINNNDTLQSIAQTVWGDSSLWYLIADANGINESQNTTLGKYAGQSIRIPNSVRTQHSSATTFTPYNAANTIGQGGSVTINQPLPAPSNQQCSLVAKIVVIAIIVVVAAVVTVASAGAAAIALGVAAEGASVMAAGVAVTTGAIAAGSSALTVAGVIAAAAFGGMAGNAASQGLQMAFGMRDKFNGRQLLVSGITSGFSAGAGAFLGGGTAVAKDLVSAGLQHFAQGSAGYIVDHFANLLVGSNKVPGADTKFDWNDMLIAGASATVSSAVTGAFGKINGSGKAKFFTELAANFSGSASHAIASQAFHGGKNDWVTISADAFGNTLASSITHSLINSGTAPQAVKGKNSSELDAYQAPDESFDLVVDESTGCPVNEPKVQIVAYVETSPCPVNEPSVEMVPVPQAVKEQFAEKYTVRSGDSIYKIAEDQLRKELDGKPSNAQIQERVYKIYEVNKDLKTYVIKTDQVLNMPDSSTEVTTDSVQRHNSSDQQYRTDVQRREFEKVVRNGENAVIQFVADASDSILSGARTVLDAYNEANHFIAQWDGDKPAFSYKVYSDKNNVGANYNYEWKKDADNYFRSKGEINYNSQDGLSLDENTAGKYVFLNYGVEPEESQNGNTDFHLFGYVEGKSRTVYRYTDREQTSINEKQVNLVLQWADFNERLGCVNVNTKLSSGSEVDHRIGHSIKMDGNGYITDIYGSYADDDAFSLVKYEKTITTDTLDTRVGQIQSTFGLDVAVLEASRGAPVKGSFNLSTTTNTIQIAGECGFDFRGISITPKVDFYWQPSFELKPIVNTAQDLYKDLTTFPTLIKL